MFSFCKDEYLKEDEICKLRWKTNLTNKRRYKSKENV